MWLDFIWINIYNFFSFLRLCNFLHINHLRSLINFKEIRLLILLIRRDLILILKLLIWKCSFESLSLFIYKILIMNILYTGFRYKWIFRYCWDLSKIKLLNWFIILNCANWDLILGFDITIEHIKIYRFLIILIYRMHLNSILSHNMFRSVSQ